MTGLSIVMAPAVNIDRIRAELRAFARIGYRPDGSVERLAFTRADLRARQLLMHRLASLRLMPRVDAIGNIFGRLTSAREEGRPAVLVGSHLDTVPGGGRFDGSAGVVAALEIAAVFREHGRVPRRPIEIVSFACEESSRFGHSMLGSGLVAGTLQPDEALDLRDAKGLTVRQVLARLGLEPSRLLSVQREAGDYRAYLELHIEQGRVLEESATPLGVVEAIAAPTRLLVDIVGRSDHSGATPMALRRDALGAAAEIVLAVERIAREAPGVVGTVGIIRAEPNVMNVVPGRVRLGIDIRSTDFDRKAAVASDVMRHVEKVAEVRKVACSTTILSDERPALLSSDLVELLTRCAVARAIPVLRMYSGAGHDAMQMVQICPAGMVLVPSRAGISHNRDEWTSVADIARGAQVMLDAVIGLADEDD
jgi:N-carbamoyl-L-amino-acid hydrolase